VDPVPDPLLLRKFGSFGNQSRDLWICSQELWPTQRRSVGYYNILRENTFLISCEIISICICIKFYISYNIVSLLCYILRTETAPWKRKLSYFMRTNIIVNILDKIVGLFLSLSLSLSHLHDVIAYLAYFTDQIYNKRIKYNLHYIIMIYSFIWNIFSTDNI
jgi:hypothetical protein